MKIRDRENRKILTGFQDMADFVTENRDPIPPLVGPNMRTKNLRYKIESIECRYFR